MQTIVLALILVVAGMLIGAVAYRFVMNHLSFRQSRYSIGILGGTSPFDLKEVPGVRNPVLTHKDVTDVSAAFVADPFMVQADGKWAMFF